MRIYEPQKELEVKFTTDVAVCGGGIAGIAAALSAVRMGKQVLLIENTFMLGGLATAGLITEFLPLCDGYGHQVSFGICDEMIRLSDAVGADEPIPAVWCAPHTTEERAGTRYQNIYYPNAYALQCEQLLCDAGVKLLYGARVCNVSEYDGKITHLIVENKTGRFAVKVQSVIDATGDADICCQSSADTAIFATGNSLAAWYYYVGNGKLNRKRMGFADQVDKNGNYVVAGGGIGRHHYTGINDLTEMSIDAHRAILEHAVSLGKFSNTYAPVTVATVPQVRMTRRLAGDATMFRADDKKYEPTSVGMFASWKQSGPVYEIPFESLYSSKVKNLLAVGRCMSSDDTMWDLTRVIPTCAVTGEAAGIAAALGDDMTVLGPKVQEELRRRGVPLHTDEVLK